jgi:hypothetical protein
LIFGISPKYHRIQNEKNEARPFKSEIPIKVHVSHLQNGLPFVEERWLADACNSFAKALDGHKPRNVKFGARYLYW